MNSKLISISAFSAGLTALFLTAGAYFEFLDLFAVVLTSVFVVLPLYYNSYKACVLSYLAGGFLAFMLSGFNIFSVVFPAYFGFFGLYPIIRCFMSKKNLNKILIYSIGLIWCIGAIFGIYFFYLAFVPEIFAGLPEFVVNHVYIILVLVSILIYFLFDISIVRMRLLCDSYLSKILK